ncbi:MAG: hypothetical protein AAGF58_00485 [Pseudomonadota bacterium]
MTSTKDGERDGSAPRPAAANSSADTESGTEGLAPEKDIEKDLFALRVMHERGLIDEETYKKRLSALTSRGAQGD